MASGEPERSVAIGPWFVRHLWRRSETAEMRILCAPLVPLARLYAWGAALHRAAYRLGRLRPGFGRPRPARLAADVVSVGNLAVGGSGKTPLVGWLARELRARGRRVAVLSRGVGGRRSTEVNVVSDGDDIRLGPEDVGDEPVLLARACPGVAVLAGRDRAALGRRAISLLGADLLILDDGFQHHRVERDLDLVCLDAGLGLGNGWTLPRGPLRESPRVLRYADALIVTRVRPELPAARVLSELAPFVAHPTLFSVEMPLRSLRPIQTWVGGDGTDAGAGTPRPDVSRPEAAAEVESLGGARLGLITAIARPDRLVDDLERMGATVKELRVFADHHLYRPSDVEGLRSDLRWVTTAKDAVKLRAEWLGGSPLEVLDEDVRPGPLPSGPSLLSSPVPDPLALPDWVLEQLGARRQAATQRTCGPSAG